MLRLHLDEHVSGAVAAGLRRHGVAVTTTADAGLLSAADAAHLEFARAEGRIVFTQDADFLRLAAAGARHAGVVYCRPGSKSVGELVRALLLIASVCTAEELADRIEYL